MRLLLLALVLPAVLAGPALTASNGVPGASAGAGSGAISGYAVSSISYVLDEQTIEAVTFVLAPGGATTVRARLASSEPWTPCTVAGAAVSCPVGTSVTAAAALEVVAAG